MKILNRSNSTKDIKWLANGSADVDIKEIVLRFKNLVLNKGTKAFDEINEELNLIIPQVTSEIHNVVILHYLCLKVYFLNSF